MILEEEYAKEFFEKSIKRGHKTGCIFQENPTPDRLILIASNSSANLHALIEQTFSANLKSIRMTQAAPLLAPEFLSEFFERQPEGIKQIFDQIPDPKDKAAFIISIFCWKIQANPLGLIASCSSCQRTAPLLSKKTLNTNFDPLKEHRLFCPIVCRTETEQSGVSEPGYLSIVKQILLDSAFFVEQTRQNSIFSTPIHATSSSTSSLLLRSKLSTTTSSISFFDEKSGFSNKELEKNAILSAHKSLSESISPYISSKFKRKLEEDKTSSSSSSSLASASKDLRLTTEKEQKSIINVENEKEAEEEEDQFEDVTPRGVIVIPETIDADTGKPHQYPEEQQQQQSKPTKKTSLDQDEMVEVEPEPEREILITFRPDSATAEMYNALAIMTDKIIPEEEPTTQEALPEPTSNDVIVSKISSPAISAAPAPKTVHHNQQQNSVDHHTTEEEEEHQNQQQENFEEDDAEDEDADNEADEQQQQEEEDEPIGLTLVHMSESENNQVVEDLMSSAQHALPPASSTGMSAAKLSNNSNTSASSSTTTTSSSSTAPIVAKPSIRTNRDSFVAPKAPPARKAKTNRRGGAATTTTTTASGRGGGGANRGNRGGKSRGGGGGNRKRK